MLIQIWNQLALVSFSPTAEDLETQFVSQFFQTFPLGSDCTERDWKLHQKQLTAEKVKEKQLFQRFLDSVLAGGSNPAGAGSNETSPASLWAEADDQSGAAAPTAGASLPEADMRHITKQLEEFTAVKAKRKQIQYALQETRSKRTLVARFAQRVRALVVAEEKLSDFDPTAPIVSLLVVMEDIRECIECGKSQRFYTKLTKDLEESSCGEDETKSENITDPAAISLLADQAAQFVTAKYIEKRLAGLPTRLHKSFTFLVAVCIAELRGDGVEKATLDRLLTRELFRGVHRDSAASTEYFPALSLDAETTDSAIARQMAQHVASLATKVGLITAETLRLLSTEDQYHDGSTAAAIARTKLSQLDASVRYACLKIQKTFTRATHDRCRKQKFDVELLDDMLQHADLWREYLKGPPTISLLTVVAAISSAPFSPSASMCLLGTGGGCGVKYRQPPPWIVECLTPLEKLLVPLCLFDSVSPALIDDFIASQLGHDSPLLGDDCQHRTIDSESTRRLASIAKSVAFSKPILLLSDPASQVTSGLSSVLQCAHKLGIREHSLSCISMGSETCIANFRLGEFSHNNLGANASAMNYSEAVRNLSSLKESSLSGGWIVVKDMDLGSLAAKNALRQQIESMRKLHANKSNEFRLWLHFESPRLKGHYLLAADDFLAHLHVERKFIEFPQTLAQYYADFLRREDERVEQQNQLLQTQQSQQQQPQPPHQLQPRRPKMMSRRTSFSVGHSQRGASPATLPINATGGAATEQWRRTQAALWVFHTVFRSHHYGTRGRFGGGDQSQADSSQSVVDVLASHFELERSLRLIQLHSREKALAATASDAVGGTSSSSLNLFQRSTSSLLLGEKFRDLVAVPEVRTIVELVAIMYMGRQWSDVREKQCRELLEWCFTGKQQPFHHHLPHRLSEATAGNEASAQLRNQLVHLREQIVDKKLSIDTNSSTTLGSSTALETRCLPLQLQRERGICESIELLSASLRVASGTLGKPVSSVKSLTKEKRQHQHLQYDPRLALAQRSLKRVYDRLPSRTSLSRSVEQQRIKRHTSIFIAYQRGTKDLEPQQIAAHVERAIGSNATATNEAWQHALLTHLMEIELPAMEAYLKHVWSTSEMILALHSDSDGVAAANALYQEITSILGALSSGFVPASWRSYRQKLTASSATGGSGKGCARPALLEHWVEWLRRAVAFYHQVQIRPRHLVDIVWMPALQHPKGLFSCVYCGYELGSIVIEAHSPSHFVAFLFAFCYNVAEAHGASVSEVSLSLSPRDGQDGDCVDDRAESSEDNSVGSTRASITVSGLYLAVRIGTSEAWIPSPYLVLTRDLYVHLSCVWCLRMPSGPRSSVFSLRVVLLPHPGSSWAVTSSSRYSPCTPRRISSRSIAASWSV